MYTSMLEEAVSRLKGEERVERPAVQLSLASRCASTKATSPEENQRLRMYKRIAGIDSDRALEEVRSELEDRYGPLPASVAHLLQAARLASNAKEIGVAQVDRKRDQLPTFASLKPAPSTPPAS